MDVRRGTPTGTPAHHEEITRDLLGDLLVAGLLTLTGVAWLVWLRHGTVTTRAALTEAAAGAAFTLPLLVPTIVAARQSLRRRAGGAAPASHLLVLAPAAALAAALGDGLHRATTGALVGSRLTATLDVAAQLLVVLVPVVALVLLAGRTPTRRARPRAVAPLLVGLTIALAPSLVTPVHAAGPVSAATPGGCLDGGPADTTFDVSALNVNIPVNRFGDHDPKGKMYALTSRVPAIRQEEASQKVSSGLHDDAIQPLVIRANEGDCVEITYTNSATGGDFGVHVDGLEFTASSSGDAVGSNAASGAAPGQHQTYRFLVPDDPTFEGAHYLHPGPGFRAAVDHGLFGTLLVEPPGSTYWDATTPGQPLLSGWEAIIKPAGTDVPCVKEAKPPTCAFREAALLHHEIGNDNEQLTAKSGALVPLVDDITGSYRPGAFALNYRSEPFRNRLKAFLKEKSHAYSSYTFGDPATPIVRGYLADPTKLRIIHVGAEKFHVFHLHGGGDRWRFNPVADTTFDYSDTGLEKDPPTVLSPSQRLDSQSLGPGESYNLEIEGGAGGVQQSVGDFLYHCHIAKHYTSGMWGLWRVFDTAQPDLVPLMDRDAPPDGVDSRDLIGSTFDGTRITRTNLDAWIRAQLPPSGIPRDQADASVWNWKVNDTPTGPLYLGAPADKTVFPDSPQLVTGQPNLLPIDAGHVVSGRPTLLFDPENGRPAYPLMRTTIGKRPPFSTQGHTGAPYLGPDASASAHASTDPYAGRRDGLCPQGRKLRTYNVVAIGKPIKRTPTFTDPDGKIFVLAHDKTATYADATRTDPLAIRANQGDCVAVTLTTEVPDASAFDKFSKNSIHIHHVQFDVQGSDGVSAGYAYEHSVRPYQVMDPTLATPAAAGATVLKLSDVTKFVGTDANGKATHPWLAVGEGLESIDIRQVESVDQTAKTVTLRTGLASAHAAGEAAGTEFIQYRWYPDTQLDNVFWHDHVDGIHAWGHGMVGQLIVEPKGSTYHDPKTGAEVDSGTLVDIHTSTPLSPGVVDGSFRELALWTLDDNDRADYSTLNLKANPLLARPDKANQFSSYKYGDPVTPLPRLYPNDPLVIRTINISPTIDTLHVQGGKTLLEPRYTHPDANGHPVPDGGLIDTVHYGVSEKFSLIFNGRSPGTAMAPGDYLYNNGIEQRTQQGAWGILRILPGRVPDLKDLPGVSSPSDPYVLPSTTGGNPPPADSPGNPCPTGAPTRSFALSAMDKSGTFNGARTAYVPSVDAAAIKKGTKKEVPLVMHAVAGECVTVRLTNLLTTPVGFAVGKVDRAVGSGGVNVGFDPDQNVAPNGTRSYVYYLPTDKIGTAPVADLAGATTLKSGLYGALVVAPASTVDGQSTEFSDPVTGRPSDLGAQVLVHVPGAATEDYRDFTVTLADDDSAIGQDFMPYPTNAVTGRSLINYQAAPAGDGNTAFRDPGAVPRLTSYAGDPVVVHVLATPGSESAHVFGLGGLTWHQDRFNASSNSVSAQGMGPWETLDAQVTGGAGGTGQEPGDYFYGDLRRPFTAVGLWGLQQVLDPAAAPCPVRRVDGSTC